MYFRTCEHYLTYENDMSGSNVCFVCLDEHLYDNVYPLKYYSYRLALCECNMHIHRTCLHNWHLYKNECPLCRKQSSLILFKSTATDKVYLVLFLLIKGLYLIYHLYIIVAIVCGLHIVLCPFKYYIQAYIN
jgi:hypothetical protein